MNIAYLNLAIPSVEDWISCRDGLVIGVDLYVQGEPLDPLLGAEVGGEALDGQRHFGRTLEGVPVHGQGVVGHLFDGTHQTCTKSLKVSSLTQFYSVAYLLTYM